MQEAIKINLALLALKKVIVALRERQPHVPYQDDRLTMLLQPSLSGNGARASLAIAQATRAPTSHLALTLCFNPPFIALFDFLISVWCLLTWLSPSARLVVATLSILIP
eukprot:6193241-Pleurochrysis_carterae.AAC.2